MINFTDIKVLVIGDCCLDIIEKGESSRIAPEAPVPVILNSTKEYGLGMAGRVAHNLANLGADVTIESIISDDKYGDKILELLKEANVKFDLYTYLTNANAITTVKKRIIANNQQVVRLDREKYSYNQDFLNGLKVTFDKYNTNQFDFIIISDYNKGFINDESWPVIESYIEKINKSGSVFIDTKKDNVLNYFEGYYLFPNSKELMNIISNYNCKNVNELLIELDTDFIVETADKKGALCYTKDGFYTSPIYKSNIIDTYGCGDTFIAAFSLFYYKFKNHKMALDFANYCCSKVVTRLGCSPVQLNELRKDELMWD